MIVMDMALNGNLRDNLLIKKYNPNDKFYNLYDILIQLEAIHKLNLVHGDLHSGNMLLCENMVIGISDLGLCKPIHQTTNVKNEIYGVLPYMAPEVLRGKPYTKASDIYSFGMIMWEMTSGVSVFRDVPHDLHLSLGVCKGLRPKIIKGTMPEYVELMKRCWDINPEKRPTVKELKIIFREWSEEYLIEEDKKREYLFLVITFFFTIVFIFTMFYWSY
jgi:serine/threonine protein kinase